MGVIAAFLISVRFPSALTSHATPPGLGWNALDASEGLRETDIHHIVMRQRLLTWLDMSSVSVPEAIRHLSGSKERSPGLTWVEAGGDNSRLQGTSRVLLNICKISAKKKMQSTSISAKLQIQLWTPACVLEAKEPSYHLRAAGFFLPWFGRWNLNLHSEEFLLFVSC